MQNIAYNSQIKPNHNYRSARGFTLLELLVVIGIILVLAGISVPLVNASIDSAKDTKCKNNLKMIAQAALLYAAEHDHQWIQAYSFTNFATVSWDNTSIWATGKITPSVLWTYTNRGGESKGVKMQQCPCFEGASNTGTSEFTGYNYNTSYIGKGSYESITEPARTMQIKNPSKTVAFGDGQYIAGANKYMRAPFGNKPYGDRSFNGRGAGTQGYDRHGGHTNVAWVNGAVVGLKDKFRKTKNSHELTNVGQENGWLSEDDSLYDLE